MEPQSIGRFITSRSTSAHGEPESAVTRARQTSMMIRADWGRDSNEQAWGGTDDSDPLVVSLTNPRVEKDGIYIDFVAPELEHGRYVIVSFFVNAYACGDSYHGGPIPDVEPNLTADVQHLGGSCSVDSEKLWIEPTPGATSAPVPMTDLSLDDFLAQLDCNEVEELVGLVQDPDLRTLEALFAEAGVVDELIPVALAEMWAVCSYS